MGLRTNKPKFGILLPTFGGSGGVQHDAPFYEKIDWDATKNYVLEMERQSFDSVWVSDHMMLGRDNAILECWTLLSYFAAITNRLELGPFVLCNSYRNPALVAKMSSTLDIISGGRLYLGFGAGWHSDEYLAYGYQFPSARDRVDSLRETLTIVKKMWSGEATTFSGKFYTVRSAICSPKPLQVPRPKILVAAFGPRMLELTANSADGWNISDDTTPDEFRMKSSEITKHCLAIGRDPHEVERTWNGHVMIENDPDIMRAKLNKLKSNMGGASMQLPSGQIVKVDPDYLIERSIHGSSKECAKKVNELVAAGVEHFILGFWDFPDNRSVTLFGSQVIPQVQKGISE